MTLQLRDAGEIQGALLPPELLVCDSFLRNGLLEEMHAYLTAKCTNVLGVYSLLAPSPKDDPPEEAIGHLFELLITLVQLRPASLSMVTDHLVSRVLLREVENGQLHTRLVALLLLLVKTIADGSSDSEGIPQGLDFGIGDDGMGETVGRVRFSDKNIDRIRSGDRSSRPPSVAVAEGSHMERSPGNQVELIRDGSHEVYDSGDETMNFSQASQVTFGDQLVYDLYTRLRAENPDNPCLQGFEEFVFMTLINKGDYEGALAIEQRLNLFGKVVALGIAQCQDLEGAEKEARQELVAMSSLDFYQLFLAVGNNEMIDRLLATVSPLHDTADLYHGLADAALSADKPDVAISHFKKALERDPEAVPVMDSYITLLIKLGCIEDAKAELGKLVRVAQARDAERRATNAADDRNTDVEDIADESVRRLSKMLARASKSR